MSKSGVVFPKGGSQTFVGEATLDKDNCLKLPNNMVKRFRAKPGQVFRWMLWTSDTEEKDRVLYVLPD